MEGRSHLGEWKGVLIANLSGFERGEGKDTAMASARRLGVILLPREAGDEEHGPHPPLLGRGGSVFEQSRILAPCRCVLHPEGRREGGDSGIAFLFWGEEVYSTFALVQLVEDEPPHLLLTEKRRA